MLLARTTETWHFRNPAFEWKDGVFLKGFELKVVKALPAVDFVALA